MKELQDRILKDGQVIGTNILKVNKFINHQVFRQSNSLPNLQKQITDIIFIVPSLQQKVNYF